MAPRWHVGATIEMSHISGNNITRPSSLRFNFIRMGTVRGRMECVELPVRSRAVKSRRRPRHAA
jgi:hypothetical protein